MYLGFDVEFAAPLWQKLMDYLQTFRSHFDKDSFGFDCGEYSIPKLKI